MHEVTKVHLGRQAFTISTAAHKALRTYLDAIEAQVHDKSLMDDIEMRMAELLAERGVHGEKVVLPDDIEFLKMQLGDPRDFSEASDDTPSESPQTKRLFRDTDTAILAGVAAGIAQYLGIDVLLVRLLFIIATFAGGWGILVYLVLWLLVPEAKTPSDRLQMAGKPVTLENLKDTVERADVKGAANRARDTLSGPINTAFRLVLKAIGAAFVVLGITLLMALAAAEIDLFIQGGGVFRDSVFPVGFSEHLLIHLAIAEVGMLALFIILFGLAIFRRKWPIHAWITGTLVGIALIGMTVLGALTADVVPKVRDRYNAGFHTSYRSLKAFQTVDLSQLGDNVNVVYRTAPTYGVSLRYYDHPDLSPVTTKVANGVLHIDTRRFNWERNCKTVCLPNSYDLTITVDSPQPLAVPAIKQPTNM